MPPLRELQAAFGRTLFEQETAAAGVLGDELPSAKYPSEQLLQRALKELRDGDVMMMHLGIRSRQEPLAPMLDPLLAGLKSRGFCFATFGGKGRP